MRITTWNVNGIRAVLNKSALDWVQVLCPDIVCLQEVKARPEQITGDLAERLQGCSAGYQAFWHPAERPGYSGVATLTNQAPTEVKFGLGNSLFDREGRALATIFGDLWLFNIYFPNGQRDHGRLTYKLDFYAWLLELCDQLHLAGKQVILCGDFNTAHNEIDLRNPRSNMQTSGFLPEERAWIDRYVQHGFVDAFRVLFPDKVQYTWWTFISNARARNVGWRLDYFMVSESLMERVVDVEIHDDLYGSDHCPVSLVLS